MPHKGQTRSALGDPHGGSRGGCLPRRGKLRGSYQVQDGVWARQKHLTPTSYAGNAERRQLKTHPELDWAVIHAQVAVESARMDETAPRRDAPKGRVSWDEQP